VRARGVVVGALALGVALVASARSAAAHPIFTTQDVTTGVPGVFDFAIDTAGVSHVSFPTYQPSRLKYGTLNGGAWSFEDVVTTGELASCAMAFDSQGRPHIAFRWVPATVNAHAQLMHAVKSGGIWTIDVVDSAINVGEYASLRFDHSDNPRISYMDITNEDLRYASFANGAWTIEVVDAIGATGWFTSLALDSLDRPLISYQRFDTGDLKFAEKTAASWTLSTVASAGNVGYGCSLALDSGGAPHISFYDGTRGVLKYASRSGSVWSIAVVDSAPSVGWGTSLALDASDRPRIAYTDSLNSDLRYAQFDGSSWHLHIPDAYRTTGFHPRLALEANGDPQIAYFEDTGALTLRFARVAPAGSGSISGTLHLDCGGVVTPASGIRVVLQLGGDPQDSVLTAGDGSYSFSPIPLGSYTLEIRETSAFRSTPAETVFTLTPGAPSQVMNLGMACRSFTVPVNLSNSGTYSRDPCLLVDLTGSLHAAWGRDPEAVAFSSSVDMGRTWSFPKDLPDQARQPKLVLTDSNQVHIVTAGFDSLRFHKSTDGGIELDPLATTIEGIRPEFPSLAVASSRDHVFWERYSTGGPVGVFFARSTDGGTTFSSPASIALNQPWPTDRHDAAHVLARGDSVYLFWNYQRFSGPASSRVLFSRSLDGGLSFSTPAPVLDTISYVFSLGDVQLDANGALCVLVYRGSPDSMIFLRSTDGGASFPQVSATPFAQPDAIIGSLACAPSGMLHLVLTMSAAVWPYQTDLFYSSSSDGGVTWSPPEDFSNTPGTSDTAILRLDATGVPIVAWREGVAGSFEIYFARKLP
jgi:hypothetical protein